MNMKIRIVVLGTAAMALLALALAGLAPRLRAAAPPEAAEQRLETNGEPIVAPTVMVAAVQAAPAEVKLVLPGTLRAWQDTPLYARAQGYLRRLHVDLGDEVEAGQLLAEIDTPDLDQELAGMRAELARARAHLALAQSIGERTEALRAQGAVSKNEADQRATEVRTRQADLDLAQARVSRLEELTRFKRVRAPFAGRITQRPADPGVLVSETTQLFRVAETGRLRVQVQVPQSHIRAVAPGLVAKLALREYPDRNFDGRVTRTAGSLDAARTMTAEIELDNTVAGLPPGLYADVELTLANSAQTALIPANALIVNQRGTQVAQVADDNILALVPVRVGRDLGAQIEILEGVAIGSRLVTNPPDTLQDGARVRVMEPRAL